MRAFKRALKVSASVLPRTRDRDLEWEDAFAIEPSARSRYRLGHVHIRLNMGMPPMGYRTLSIIIWILAIHASESVLAAESIPNQFLGQWMVVVDEDEVNSDDQLKGDAYLAQTDSSFISTNIFKKCK
jgi:hypothetical protein